MSNFVAETCGTIAGAILVKTIVTNWLSDYLEIILRKVFVRTKRSYIVWTHSVRHKLDTPDHDSHLFQCQDPPCDLLTKHDPHDLGLPGSWPVSK
jgi:hypothetical protein